jgi:hypothetical protein
MWTISVYRLTRLHTTSSRSAPCALVLEPNVSYYRAQASGLLLAVCYHVVLPWYRKRMIHLFAPAARDAANTKQLRGAASVLIIAAAAFGIARRVASAAVQKLCSVCVPGIALVRLLLLLSSSSACCCC